MPRPLAAFAIGRGKQILFGQPFVLFVAKRLQSLAGVLLEGGFVIRTSVVLSICVVVMSCMSPLMAQSNASSNGVVPPLVKYSGKVSDAQGKPLAGVAGVTFSIYKEQEGGAPLWMETQNVEADKAGHYTVQLGAGNSAGLPTDLFASGEARWLGVRVNSDAEQSRTLLLSVPYALKAMDAETLGGKPASAFLQAIQPGQAESTQNDSHAPLLSPVYGSGTTSYLPIWTATNTIGRSNLFQNSSGNIGLGTTAPIATLDVRGTVSASLGVSGLSSGSATAGVSGQNTSSGYGLLGLATGTSGQGVWGESSGTADSNGAGADGVHGVTHSSAGSGVAGLNSDPAGIGTYGQGGGYGVFGVAASKGRVLANGIGVYGGSTFGTGVYGTAPDGFGFATDSNVQQARTAGGWVKALLYVNTAQAPYTIQRCFNSTLSGSAATTPPCGFNLLENFSGDFTIDMGFEVDDRFVTATAYGDFALPWILFQDSHTYNILWYRVLSQTVGAGEYYWLAVY
jgi:hypothetical protein